MDSKLVAVALVAASFGLPCFSENLIEGGDFSNAATNLAPLCRGCFSGRLSLYTEPLTWNKCGKCEVARGYPDVQYKGCVIHGASASIGTSGGRPGFPVEPDTVYEFSFDVKGNVPSLGVDVTCWSGDDDTKGRQKAKVTLPDKSVSGEWTVRKGTFRTPADARRAELNLYLWSSSKWKDCRYQFRPGSYFLFDNVKVERSRKNLGADGTPAMVAKKVEVRKTVAPGDTFSDLVSYRDAKVPAQVKTLFGVRRENDAILIDVTAEEPETVVTGNTSQVWSGDSVELIFGGKDDGRVKTHIAFNLAGAKYTAGADLISNDGWDLRTQVGEGTWQASVKVPFAFLGWTDPKGEIPLNVGRSRSKARQFDVWCAKGAFHDVSAFGRIVIDGYAAALKSEFGIAAEPKDRAEFEARCLAELTARQAAKFAKFKDSKMSVAPVSVVSDWAQPYLPEEIFDPPEKIELKAAVNEIRALPLAIANLTDRTEDYRVVLETAEDSFIGDWGLAGFPADQVVARKGVRFRDVENPSPTMRFDPLPRLDEAGTLTVPPREAGLVWYDFDCTGVKPGVYRGRLRVIPLCEPGKCRSKNGAMDYAGKMRTIPVSLEVVNAAISNRPAVPAGYFLGVESQAAFDLAFQIGAEHFQINSWSFKFEKDANGDLDLNRPRNWVTNVFRSVSNHVAWAKKHGFTPKFKIVYSAMDACRSMYLCGKDPEKFRRYWPQYVKSVKRTMNAAGVPDSDYFIEVKDEPKAEILDELLEAHRIAKEAEPTVRLAMLLGAWDLPQAKLDEFVPYSDLWVLWRGKFDGASGRAFAARLLKDGKDVFCYLCETSIRLSLQNYFRLHAWYAERYGLTGAYLYQLTDTVGGGRFGAVDFKSIPYAGLFYRSFGTPVPSLRLMALREGFTDAKFMAALRAKNAKANDPEISEFLRTAAEEVVRKHPYDVTLPDRMRDRARALLVR